jgi:energy-coupling factor transporter transmembrane protein EcfT
MNWLPADYPGRFEQRDSLMHRQAPWLKFLIAFAMAATATQVSMPYAIAAVLLAELCLYLLARIRSRSIWRDFRVVLIQAPLVISLYIWRDGWAGWTGGAIVAAKIGATLLPIFWLQRCTRINDLIESFGWLLPKRLNFVLFASLRFLPLLLRDAREIVALQTLRGARIQGRHLLNPLRWPELARCVIVPVLVRTVKLASEVALSAQSRGIAEADPQAWLRRAEKDARAPRQDQFG